MAAPTLKRTLGLWQTTMIGVGVILGAGIYALIGEVAGLGGDSVWMSFVAAAVVAGFTGLSYAELASMIPRAGGEYHYARRAFGPLVAFLCSWLLLVGLAIAAAAVALGFGGYLTVLAPLPAQAGAVLLVVVCGLILLAGVRQAAWIALLCTALEVGGLVAVLAVGLPHVGEVDLLTLDHGLGGLGAAAALIFFAYIGFEEIVQLAEETHDPTRTLPRALLMSIVISTVLYVLVSIAAISVLGWEALAASESPLADVVEAGAGWHFGAGLAVIALFSTGNTVLVLLLSASRLVFGMAEDGALTKHLARLGRRGTPTLATALVCVAACVVVGLEGELQRIANLTNVALFATFILMNGAVIALRVREPETPRPFRVPLSVGRWPVVPLLGIASVVAMMTQVELGTLLLGAVLLAVGLVFRRTTAA